MSITWTEDAESQLRGTSAILQQNTASFGASDYVAGGYPVYPASFGLGAIRGLVVAGVSGTGAGTPGAVEWEAVAPATAGPAASNPWHLQAGYHGTGNAWNESASNTNFSGGTLRVLAFGY